jgi:predicted transcriptional regulator
MEVLKLHQVMTRDVFTVPASLSRDEAAWALMHRGVSGAPVRDDDGRLVGVISTSDLVDPERGGGVDEIQTVADIMTPAVMALEADDTIFDAVQMMTSHGLHRVIVVDRDGMLVGIVTPTDFLRRLLRDGHLEAHDDSGAKHDHDPADARMNGLSAERHGSGHH